MATGSSTAALAIRSSASVAGTMLTTATTAPDIAKAHSPAARCSGVYRLIRLESPDIQILGKCSTHGGRNRSTGAHQTGLRRADRRGGNAPQAEDRARAQDQARPGPDRARPAPRPYRGDQQAAPFPGPRPPGAVPDRRLHGDDRRPERQEPDAAAAVARADPGEREKLPRADVENPRPGQDAGDVQFRVVGQAGRRGHDPARLALHGGAAARARRFQQALQEPAADRGARAAVSPDAGLRLGG